MKIIRFSLYYCKLYLGVVLGLHHTANPLDLNWRWRLWKQRQDATRNGRFSRY